MSQATGRLLVYAATTYLIVASSFANGENKPIPLPEPAYVGKLAVEAAMAARQTVRKYTGTPLTPAQLSQLLWSAYGNRPKKTAKGRWRKVVPSAGALYPLEIYAALGPGTAKTLPAGIYHYLPDKHALESVVKADKRQDIAKAALGQMWLAGAPVVIVICGVYERTSGKYGKRADRYVHMEAGNSNQNLYLQAESLGLHVGTVGAFKDKLLRRIMKLPADTSPLLIVPAGS